VEPRGVPLSFGEALRFWLKLGFISFGGPTGQIAIMHQELVERRRWISEGRFLHALNYCMLLPGPEAQQLATYIGWLMHRTWGGIVAGGLFVLPSVFIMIALSWIYLAYGEVPLVAGVFYGIKPAVVAIVLAAAHRIGSRTLKNAWLWAIAAAAFIAIFAFHAPFPAIVIAGGHAGAHASFGPALIDEDTPTPEHARFSWKKFSAFGFAGLALWALVLGALAAAHGWDGTLPQMGWFFTKAALVTFGGAYAVLPYVVQAAVEQYHWLTAPQMIDGLALGETTPGPLIMVVAFVGFIGAGVAGALVATFFTFLPSFIFIFMGAPFIETTHGDLRFTAPLTGITAAVVGVILNLAVFFAYHVLWPEGRSAPFDWASAVIGVAAFVALFRFKAGIIPVIAACAALGLAARLLL